MTGTLLVINSGSSSVKFQLFGLDPAKTLPLLARGKVADIGETPVLTAAAESGKTADAIALPAASTHEESLLAILKWIDEHQVGAPVHVAGHRIVHGGTEFQGPVVVDEAVLAKLRALAPLAPLHQPHNLAAIDILAKLKPGIRQIACFDTAFHAHHEPLFSAYAVPSDLAEKGIRRYGFHGLSYEWIVHVLKRDYPHLAQKRMILAHLGNGASLCALKDGKSIDTTMGMTALDGLPMGTRSGSLDPGAVLYMIRDLGLSPDRAEHRLYNDSGLKGLSGFSGDVRELSASRDPRAAFALDYFVLKAAQFVAMMAVSIGGMDGIVFTGGIGENAASVREKILKHLAPFGALESIVIPANEERVIAMQAVSC